MSGPGQQSPAGVPKPTGTHRGSKLSSAGGGGAEAAGGLHLVATPIGNLRDVTLRALDVLRLADCIACEDTRVTGRLLSAYDIQRPTIAYHDHNAARVRPQLMGRLQRGETIALVSDAGTPLVSDPGYRLVAACLEADVPVHALPGPSAPITALVLSGLPSDRFLFAGFLPPRRGPRRRALEDLAEVGATLLFFESGPRLGASLADMAEVLGDRPAAVARELTKLYEEVVRDPLAVLARRYGEGAAPKGEIVVVVGPPQAREARPEELDGLLREALATMGVRDAAASVAAATGAAKRDLYRRALALKAAGPRDEPHDDPA